MGKDHAVGDFFGQVSAGDARTEQKTYCQCSPEAFSYGWSNWHIGQAKCLASIPKYGKSEKANCGNDSVAKMDRASVRDVPSEEFTDDLLLRMDGDVLILPKSWWCSNTYCCWLSRSMVPVARSKSFVSRTVVSGLDFMEFRLLACLLRCAIRRHRRVIVRSKRSLIYE